METQQPTITVPDNFPGIIRDFTRDLTTTFPEFAYLWQQWMSGEGMTELYSHVISVYPERFFDILYQNDEIFKAESEANVYFLPGVNFKSLFNCEGVSESTKKAMWKYLQLILLSTIGSIKNKDAFGESSNLFDGIDEDELNTKLKDMFVDIEQFFTKLETNEPTANESSEQPEGEGAAPFAGFENMPKPEELRDHLSTLFDGKIGKLAKEMAEEMAGDINGLLGEEEAKNIKTSGDVIKQLIRNPKKIMKLAKTVGEKFDAKMKSGEISQEDIQKEAGEIFDKMKGMGFGGDNMADMMKTFAKTMGGGKGGQLNMNAMSNMLKANTQKERMRQKLDAKREAMNNQSASQQDTRFHLDKKGDSRFVFRVDGEEQKKSSIKSAPTSVAQTNHKNEMEEIDRIAAELNLTEADVNVSKSVKKKNGGKKK